MFNIESVEITGFWGQSKAYVDFNDDVTIFIGRNGTGKTTFINLLEAALRADMRTLSTLDFDTITLKLKDKNKVRTISVSKEPSEKDEHLFTHVPYLTFLVGRKKFRMPVLPLDFQRHFFTSSSYASDYGSLKQTLDELINIASLSVHRTDKEGSVESFETSERPERSKIAVSPIDTRLQSLLQRLTGYQLTLSEKASVVSSELQRDVLQSMLYNQEFDSFRLNDMEVIDTDNQKKELIKAYKELSAFNKTVEGKIDAHFDALDKSIHSIKSETAQLVDDIMPLPLLRRTQKVIELARKAEEKKQDIFRPIRRFEKIVREFMLDKDFNIASNGDLQMKKGGKKISISNLSSGEKQLLILLTETLLQKNEPFIFLADEPEISLHIGWQAQIIDSIKRLNENAQIIIATHSPEVAGNWQKSIVDMEDIVHE